MRYLVLALLAMPQLALAQTWCPPGAEWYYGYAEVSTGQVGYLHVEYVGDTIANGDTYQILHRFLDAYDHQSQTYYNGYENPIYTTVTGGLIQMTYNFVDVGTIYDFDALPGDSWGPYIWGAPGQQILVIDTGTTQIDGHSLKYSLVEYESSIFGPSPFNQDTLIERLGFLQLTMQTLDAFIWDIGTYQLRCYSDQDISYQKPNSLPCDFILGLDDLNGQVDISVFPNPVSDVLRVEGLNPNSSYQLELFDQTGRSVLRESVRGSAILQIGQLESGIYLYRIQAVSGGQVYSGRIVKE